MTHQGNIGFVPKPVTIAANVSTHPVTGHARSTRKNINVTSQKFMAGVPKLATTATRGAKPRPVLDWKLATVSCLSFNIFEFPTHFLAADSRMMHNICLLIRWKNYLPNN